MRMTEAASLRRAMADTVRRGEELRKRFGRGSGPGALLVDGADDPDTLKKLNQFHAGPRPDLAVRLPDGGPTAETVSWFLHGGDAGAEWAGSELLKRSEGLEEKRIEVEVAKADATLGVVFGYAIVCKEDGEDYYDVQGDHVPESAMLEATASFMRGHRVAKDMHAGEPCGKVVYGFPITGDIAKALGLDTRRTGFLVGMAPDDRDTLAKFVSGEYTGFSMGGRRVKDTEVTS